APRLSRADVAAEAPATAALPGHRDARGRLPPRPRLDPGAGPRRRGAAEPAPPRGDRLRPGDGRREADRGGLGRGRALPGGQLPELGTLGGVERQVPRRGPALREERRGDGATAGDPTLERPRPLP